MNNFKKKITNIEPEHDYPVGLIHPYWARKPINITEQLILNFSKKGDFVLDPFMGSGTSIFASLKNGRNAVGSDLSPISHLLVKSVLSGKSNSKKYKKILNAATDKWNSKAISLYQIKDNYCVERELYRVEGDYNFSKFTLKLLEAKIKPIKDGALKGKITKTTTTKYTIPKTSLNKSTPIDFEKIEFTENTRIAIHKGVKASDFFTDRNKDFINFCIYDIESSDFSPEEKDFLKTYLSSMLPLLRLSDKKASSQWPYWRPKNELTSRNPVIAIKRRKKAFDEMLDWCEQHLSSKSVSSSIFNCSAQNLGDKLKRKIDLIVTDPPYADHAPYMEYTDFYWSIIDGTRTKHLWKEEIVKTNAIGRTEDSSQYEARMEQAIRSLLKLLNDDGYFIFFYLDKNIEHWDAIKSAIFTESAFIEDVIPIQKQRRSMKTVTSPGKTLDGDLIIICKKRPGQNIPQKKVALEKIINDLPNDSYFMRFSYFIKMYLTCHITGLESKNKKDISRIL